MPRTPKPQPKTKKDPVVNITVKAPGIAPEDQDRLPILIEESAADLERQIARLQKNARAKRAKK